MVEYVSYIYETNEILKDLNLHITKKLPFSTIRFGDACFGIVSKFLCPEVITKGKWSGKRGLKFSNSILGQLGIPSKKRIDVIKQLIYLANDANYIDSYDAFSSLNTKKGVGIIGKKWKEIHEKAGITNTNYCNNFLHYFSIVDKEYNLFNIMKRRKVFCICNRKHVIRLLKEKSKAKVMDFYIIPKRGRSAGHYKNHFHLVEKTIKQNAKKYDLFLIGAGLLGCIYCGLVKENGGRAFDSGRLFDIWAGQRVIDSRPKRFITYDSSKMLCNRIKKGKRGW